MHITLKLFATLAAHLPPGAKLNQAQVEAEEGCTVLGLIERFQVPPALCTLVLVNGVFVTPGQLATRIVESGDVLAIWPPVGGG